MQTQTPRDSLFLTIILPAKTSSYKPFHAAMLSFPQGNVQQVVDQLRDTALLRQILDGLENDPDNLTKASKRMAGNGCPDVEIAPVDTVGYYQLQTG